MTQIRLHPLPSMLLAATLTVVALPASAEKGAKMQAHFAKMDTDANGFVSQEEYVEARTQKARDRFAKMDVDGDGTLSMEEMKMSRKALKEERMARKGK